MGGEAVLGKPNGRPRPWFPFCRGLSFNPVPAPTGTGAALHSARACTALRTWRGPSTGGGWGDEPRPAAGSLRAHSCCCRRPSTSTLGGARGCRSVRWDRSGSWSGVGVLSQLLHSRRWTSDDPAAL